MPEVPEWDAQLRGGVLRALGEHMTDHLEPRMK
jgi:hypothetical protein